jgi:predicted permease
MRLLTGLSAAWRSLTHAPAFSLLVVLTLGLGIGAVTAIFSVVHGVVLRPLPYPAPEQLIRITSELRGFSATDTGVSAPELFDYQARTDLFSAVAGVLPVSANVTNGGMAARVELVLASGTYFEVLRVPPLHGRVFTPADETAGVANLAVVSHGFWERHLGADPAAIGRSIDVDGDVVEVIGVMPRGFEHPGRTLQAGVDLWSPAGFRGPQGSQPSRARRRLDGAIARLQPGVTADRVSSALEAYGATATRQHPADYPTEHGWRPRGIPLQDHLVAGVARPMFVLLAGVGLLLLVACTNVAHLVLARSAGRVQEMAIRQALGAGRGRLALQLAAETALLAAAGAAAGILIASWGLRALALLAPPNLPRLDSVRLDAAPLGVAILIAAIVTVVFTLVPLFDLRGRAMFPALKDGGRGRHTDRRGGRARNVLVATEIALATVLLVGAGLFVRTVLEMLRVPVGFEAERLITARITLPRPNAPAQAVYLDPARRTALYREVHRRLSEIPGVERAALSSQVPLGGFAPPLLLEFTGTEAATTAARPAAHQFQVTPSFFETLGVRILRGRAFTDADRAGGEQVAIVSEAAARVFWPGLDPVGQRVRYAPETPWITVVGVAADVLNRRLTEPPQPILYRPVEQSSDLSMAMLVRLSDSNRDISRTLAGAVSAVDPGVPVHAVRSMEDLISANIAQRRFLMRLLVLFGGLAAVLALIGIYGVMSYAVTQRTREIGIRLAIGARPSDVSRMVVYRGLTLTAMGLGLGVLAALLSARLVASQLFGVRAADPVALAAALVLMTAVAWAAAYLPARRASRIDPVLALRAE